MHHATAHGGAQALDLSRRGDCDHVHRRMVFLAKLLQHLEPAHVGKVDVQQHEVGPKLVHSLEGAQSGVRSAHHLETGYAIDVSAVEIGHPVVVVDDECADHDFKATCIGIRTVNSAPPSLTTVTVPPWRCAICRTSARPKPRRFRPCPFPSFVLKPSWKICPSRPSWIPGPESWTCMTTSPSCSVTETLTQR